MTGLYWRQIIKLDKIDACALATGATNIDFLKAMRDEYIRMFPNLPAKCPIEPGKYYAKNVTFFDHNNPLFEWREFQLVTPSLPNGIYRHVVKFYNDEDPVGFMIYFHIELYDKMGDDRF